MDSHIPSHIVEEGDETVSKQIRAHLQEETEQELQRVSTRLEEAGFTVENRLLQGDPGTEICALAEKQNVDGIIMGRRGLGSLGEFLLGSVSNHVVHHAPCPVLIVPRDRS